MQCNNLYWCTLLDQVEKPNRYTKQRQISDPEYKPNIQKCVRLLSLTAKVEAGGSEMFSSVIT